MLLLASALFASACGSRSDSSVGTIVGDLTGRDFTNLVQQQTTTTLPPPTTTLPPPTTTVRQLAPNETLVATVKPAVRVLHTFEEPDGEPVRFEDPLTNPTYFGSDLVLMVTDEEPDGSWLEVQIPVRPNGTEAWIRAADVTLSTHEYRAQVDLTERSVTVWNGDELVVETGAVVGKEQTPTPLGSFYVNELIAKWEGSAYGPYILGLSAFSEALETFNGGIPVIAIHGTNRPELIGGAHSNGCIRIPNEAVTILAETVPMGTPVDIVA
jgi:lipoprotein-anchoring transpeptidase ErfK/SrfK